MNDVGEQLSLFAPDTWSGRTCQERSPATRVKTSGRSSKKRSGSLTRQPMFLDLRRENGRTPAQSWETGTVWLGVYTMPSFGESPSVDAVSRLSAILQDGQLQRYYLSAKACRGILKRAERRGKKLPEALERALREQANRSASNHEVKTDAPESIGGVTPTLNTAQGGQRTPCVTIPINMMVATKTSPETRTTFGIGQDGAPQFTISSTHSHAVCAGFSFGQSEKARSIGYQEEKSPTLRGGEGGNQKPCVLSIGNGQLNQIPMSETANTLDTMHDQQAVMVLNDQGGSVMDVSNESTATLRAQSHGHEPAVMNQSVVRRLTPLEYERLQGYPDGWTDIGEWVDSKGRVRKTTDTVRYKALGNSIALPFWFWLLRRISAQYYRPATLGSLFDGIGGFPLCWERCNGPGTALWASEIEEFPIAVTKKRFESAPDAPCAR